MTASEPGSPASPDPRRSLRLGGTPAARRGRRGSAVVTAYLVYQDVTAEATSLGVAIALTVFAALGAVAVAALARALARRSARARGPAIVVQLMLLVIAYYMLQAGCSGSACRCSPSASPPVFCSSPPTTRALWDWTEIRSSPISRSCGRTRSEGLRWVRKSSRRRPAPGMRRLRGVETQ